jgi:hypothetical protein
MLLAALTLVSTALAPKDKDQGLFASCAWDNNPTNNTTAVINLFKCFIFVLFKFFSKYPAKVISINLNTKGFVKNLIKRGLFAYLNDV